jgi:sterol desaturase/sphingolipid hydroxylase (fatty acid hydroxylase superfamily)
MRQSAISYFADMVLSPLLAIVLCGIALVNITRLGFVQWLAAVLAGAAFWTFFEYVMHRVIYHHFPVFKGYHGAHHESPLAYIGAPPVVATGAVFLIGFAPLAAFSPLLANGTSVGMLLGYTVYALVHHACHFWAPRRGTYLYRLRLHHALHHHRSDEGNFGVTTPFWDHVFGTRIR